MKLEEEIFQKHFRSEYQKAFINLIYTFNWLNQYQQSILKKYEITIQQFNILRILRGQYPNCATITLLKERMLDKMSDASRIVDKLLTKDLVIRKISKDDRRKVDVIISKSGLKLLKDLDKFDNVMDSFFSNLNEKEVMKLNELLDKLRN